MAIEYRLKFENGVMTITPVGNSGKPGATVQQSAASPVLWSHQISRPQSGQGGGSNPSTDPGGGSNPSTDPGGGSNPSTDPGGGSNPSTDPGGGGIPPRALSPGQNYAASFFEMEKQEESEWCWAAVSASVDHFFNPGTSHTQCEIASEVTQGDCCSNPALFDQPERLQDALSAVGRLRKITGPLTFDQVKAELDANRPVCVRIAWDGEGAHFVAISGYQVLTSGIRTIDIADPHYADSTFDFDLFPSHYQGGGSWTATFLTKAQKGASNVNEFDPALRNTTYL